jgi:hypothetical protein
MSPCRESLQGAQIMVRIATFSGNVLVGLAFLVFAQENPPQKSNGGKNTATASRSAAARKALAERIEVPEEFRKPGQPVPLRLALAYIDEKLANQNKTLPFAVEQATFKDGNNGDPLDILESNVSLPPFFKSMTVQEMLEIMLKQAPIPTTYLLRNGHIVILARDAANIHGLLDQGIAIQFRDVPLKFAIEDLADRTGLTVMVDPRCGAGLSTSVTLQTQNDVSVRGILTSWADMFDLKMMVNDHRVFLMPRAEYLKKLHDQLEESHLLQKIGPELSDDLSIRRRFEKASGM